MVCKNILSHQTQGCPNFPEEFEYLLSVSQQLSLCVSAEVSEPLLLCIQSVRSASRRCRQGISGNSCSGEKMQRESLWHGGRGGSEAVTATGSGVGGGIQRYDTANRLCDSGGNHCGKT